MIFYPLVLEQTAEGCRITCAGLEEVEVRASTREEALSLAQAEVYDALIGRLLHANALPRPRTEAQPAAIISTLLGLRMSLHWALEEEGVSRDELAKLLGWPDEDVESLFRHDQSTSLDLFDRAFAALGKHLRFDVV